MFKIRFCFDPEKFNPPISLEVVWNFVPSPGYIIDFASADDNDMIGMVVTENPFYKVANSMHFLSLRPHLLTDRDAWDWLTKEGGFK